MRSFRVKMIDHMEFSSLSEWLSAFYNNLVVKFPKFYMYYTYTYYTIHDLLSAHINTAIKHIAFGFYKHLATPSTYFSEYDVKVSDRVVVLLVRDYKHEELLPRRPKQEALEPLAIIDHVHSIEPYLRDTIYGKVVFPVIT